MENSGHRSRLREKFLKGGLQSFLDYEVVELLLALGTPRKNCKQQAKEAIQKFKTLGGVLEAEEGELQEIKGIGPHNIFGIKFIQEVSRIFLKEKILKKPFCHSSQEVFDYLYHTLRYSKKEKFKILLLDTKNQILEERTCFEGTVNTSAVYPREIMKAALRYGASSLILVHNHPSGNPEPSITDKEITKDLVFAGHVMGIKVLDHIIIGGNHYFSFADERMIEKYDYFFQDFRRKY